MLALLISISEVVLIELLDAVRCQCCPVYVMDYGRHNARPRRGAHCPVPSHQREVVSPPSDPVDALLFQANTLASSKNAMFPGKCAALLSTVDHDITVREHHTNFASTAPLPTPL